MTNPRRDKVMFVWLVAHRNFDNDAQTTLVGAIFEANGTAVQIHNTTADRQSQSTPCILTLRFARIYPDERLEYLR